MMMTMNFHRWSSMISMFSFVYDVYVRQLANVFFLILLERSARLNMFEDEHCELDDLDLFLYSPFFSTRDTKKDETIGQLDDLFSNILPWLDDFETKLEFSIRLNLI